MCYLALFLFAGAYVVAQETDSQSIPDTPQNAAVKNVPAAQKQDAKKKAQPKAAAPKQKVEDRIQSLLPVAEGNFKYGRIPEITLPQAAQGGDISYVPEDTQKETAVMAEDKKPPFYLRAGSDLPKVIILLLILGIFILYRVNSKKGRRRKQFKH